MWRLIDNDVISQELRIGHIISENTTRHENYQIVEIRENGVVTAAKTDTKNFMIVFPKDNLVDANWWIMD